MPDRLARRPIAPPRVLWSLAAALVPIASACASHRSSVSTPGPSPHERCTPAAPEGCERECRAGGSNACLTAGRAERERGANAHERARAVRWFSQACDLGSGEGCEQAGKLLFDISAGSDPIEPGAAPPEAPIHRALAFFARACDRDMPESCARVADITWTGEDGGPRDLERARDAYTRACELGKTPVCKHVAELIAQGEVPGTLDDAARLFRRVCEAKDDPDREQACAREADMYAHGAGNDDPARVFDVFDTQCRFGRATGEIGSGGACLRLAGLWTGARRHAVDSAASVAALARACDLGQILGCSMAAARAADAGQRVAFQVKACNLGAGSACLSAAAAYAAGDGVPLDAAKAKALREVACSRDLLGCPGPHLSKMQRDELLWQRHQNGGTIQP